MWCLESIVTANDNVINGTPVEKAFISPQLNPQLEGVVPAYLMKPWPGSPIPMSRATNQNIYNPDD